MTDQEKNVLFVEEVKRHEVLYDYNLPGYSRKDVTEKAWQRVADKVNMSAIECREKWRNLRTVLVRKMKPSRSGAKKKAYYLAEAMQFCMPFIKTSTPWSCRNLPEVTEDKTEEKAERCDVNELFCPGMIVTGCTSTPKESSCPSPVNLDKTDESELSQYSTQVQSSSSRPMKSQTIVNKSEAEKALLETATNSHETAFSSHNIERKEALKMFLLSLIPELEEFSDSQIKLFKRKIFSVIDEISTLSQS